jgi:hypothetical protein
MAFLSMVLLIMGAGSVLLGIGWTATDGASKSTLKPLLVGTVMVGLGLSIPVGNTMVDADPRTAEMVFDEPPADVGPPPGPPPDGHPMPGLHPPPHPPPGNSTNSPVEDLNLAVWPTVATRVRFACATDPKGQASCWGEPVAIGDKPVAQIALGREHGCALATTGQAECWGTANPENQRLRQHRFIALASTLESTCGLTKKGIVQCWGDTIGRPPSNLRYRFISGGAAHFCALNTSGEAVCWGDNSEGQSTPLPGPYTAISAGHFHTCGLKTDSTVQCWGRNQEGQSSPPETRFRQISAGWAHSCGINQSGSVQCWGCGSKSAAVAMANDSACRPPSGQFVAVSAGDLWKSCAVTAQGKAACWGGLAYEGEPQ